MPYKKSYKKKASSKRKVSSKSYRRYPKRKTTSLQKMVVFGRGLPDKCMVTHKYNEIVEISTTAGSIGNYQFSANGLYDSNYSSGGHQPLYYDQMSALYDHYTVIGSKITARVFQKAATNDGVTVTLFLNDDTNIVPALVSTMKEQSRARWVQLAPADNTTHSLSMKFSAKRIFGGNILSNPNLQGSLSANPTEGSFYTFCMQSTNGTTNESVVLDVSIEYIVVWSELRDIQGS